MADPVTTQKKSDSVIAMGPPGPGQTVANKKQYIGVANDYKAQVHTKQSKVTDALGREIVDNTATITDPSKQVRHKDVAKNQSNDPLKNDKPVFDRKGRQIVPDDFNGVISYGGTAKNRDFGENVYGGKFGRTFDPKTMVHYSDADLGPGEFKASEAPDMVSSIAPRYMVGDEMKPAGIAQEDMIAFQRKLVDAGVLSKKFKNFGVWDETSQAAYTKLLGYSNQAGVDQEEMLKRWKDFGIDAEKTPGKVLTTKDPNMIGQIFQQTAGKTIGRSLTPGELAVMVDNFQKLDTQSQEANIAAQEASAEGQDVTVADAPDESSFAAEQLKAKFKPEADYVVGDQNLQKFFSVLGEGGSMSRGS